jgi:hypothetical protein
VSAQLQQSNSFSAHLALAAGVAVSITAETMEQLANVVGKLQATAPAANDSKPAKENKAKPEPQEQPGNASASTNTQASAPPAASGSEPAADAKRFTYDDVKARVLAMAKVSRDLATKTLGNFKTVGGDKVDHGNKLQLEDYPAFIEAADKALAAAKGGASA